MDIPDATIMVIEHAERFGLAQLHQLRGRVGRGDQSSHCILAYKSPLGQVAKARINIMRESEDGFRIAEEDLRLRGEGELLGEFANLASRGFALASSEHHGDILEMARDDARLIVETDPNLRRRTRAKHLRILLLFVWSRSGDTPIAFWLICALAFLTYSSLALHRCLFLITHLGRLLRS